MWLRLRTHIATSLAIAYLVDAYVAAHDPEYAQHILTRIAWYIIAVIIQYVIDAYGHTWIEWGKRIIPVRNRFHSLPAILALGLSVGLLVLSATHHKEHLLGSVGFTVSHWLEDAVTEAGVYIGRKRVRLPIRIPYDSVKANRITVLASATLVLLPGPPRDTYTLIFFIAVILYILSSL